MENPLLEKMGSGNLNSISDSLEENAGGKKICVAHQTLDGLEYGGKNADSFVVDIERLSTRLSDKNANSRVTSQRSFSRKGSMQRGGEKKSNSGIINNDNSLLATSPRAALQGASVPEKPVVVTVGATDYSTTVQPHNSITIMTGSSAGGGAATIERKLGGGGRRFSFRRSSTTWTIDPRRILFIFATFSSMGTILLIYFTLSMTKLNGEDNGLN